MASSLADVVQGAIWKDPNSRVLYLTHDPHSLAMQFSRLIVQPEIPINGGQLPENLAIVVLGFSPTHRQQKILNRRCRKQGVKLVEAAPPYALVIRAITQVLSRSHNLPDGRMLRALAEAEPVSSRDQGPRRFRNGEAKEFVLRHYAEVARRCQSGIGIARELSAMALAENYRVSAESFHMAILRHVKPADR